MGKQLNGGALGSPDQGTRDRIYLDKTRVYQDTGTK